MAATRQKESRRRICLRGRREPLPSNAGGSNSANDRYHAVRTKGATTRTPPVSPIHHVHHLPKTASEGSMPPKYRLATPTVHAIRHIESAIPTKIRDCLNRSNGFSVPRNRRNRVAPAMACSSDPVSIPTPVARKPKTHERIRMRHRRPVVSQKCTQPNPRPDAIAQDHERRERYRQTGAKLR